MTDTTAAPQKENLLIYLINLEGQDAEIAPTRRRGLDRNSLKVGDRVAFTDRDGREQFGEVVKLNQKSAAVQVGGVPRPTTDASLPIRPDRAGSSRMAESAAIPHSRSRRTIGAILNPGH